MTQKTGDVKQNHGVTLEKFLTKRGAPRNAHAADPPTRGSVICFAATGYARRAANALQRNDLPPVGTPLLG